MKEDKKKVLCVVLHPTLANFKILKGFNQDTLMSTLEAQRDKLNSLDYAAELFFIKSEETACSELKIHISKTDYDWILFGGGIRLRAENTKFFEKLVNLVHEYAQKAKICFNTMPDDTAETIQRWA